MGKDWKLWLSLRKVRGAEREEVWGNFLLLSLDRHVGFLGVSVRQNYIVNISTF